MMNCVRFAAAKIIGWLPNLVVLAVLAGIGWWGHRNHWTLPHQGQTHGKDSRPLTEKSPAATAETQPAALIRRTLVDEQLPPIEFSSAAAARRCGIATAVAWRQAMNDFVEASGAVGYDQTRLAQLSVRVPGIVWRVEKRVGERVERGDVLMIVDSAEVGAAKAALLEAAVVYRLKQQTRARLEEVQSSVSMRSLREAEAAEEVARAQRFNALQRLLNLGFALSLEEIEGLPSDAIAERLHVLGLPKSLDCATPSANLIPLVAPFTGIITHCEVVRGEIVGSDISQYTIADTGRMWINLDIRDEDCAKVRLGATVVFSSDGGQAAVTGKLTWIGTEINPRTRTVQARAEVENPALEDSSGETMGRRTLQVNSFGTAEIFISASPETVVIPNEAMHWQWELGREIVFVPSPDGRRFEPRVIRKGLVRDDCVQVLEGLAPGEHVVTAGSRILMSELSETLRERWGDNDQAVRAFSLAPAVE
jgi:cobalt-zinc-cadmium efflux system membrane fusion protein